MAIVHSNTDFLKAIFGDQWTRAHVTQFPQAPDSAQGGSWKGMSAGKANGQLDMADWNQFYTVSLFREAEDGSSKRTKDLFEAQYALVLDDLGSGPGAKIPMSVLDGRPLPQYAVETSKDNWQIIYIFEQPVKDADLMARLIDALIEQGLSADADPGMAGVTRYVRLPNAINNKEKYGEIFHCKLTEIDPTGRVTVPQIVEGWGLTVAPPGKGRYVAVESPEAVMASLSYKLLSEHNLWTGEQDNGYWGTPCPQQEMHTVDDGRHGINLQTGAFKCMHGSCEHLNRGDLEAWLMRQFPEEAVTMVFGAPAGKVAPGVDEFIRRGGMLSSDQVDQANALIFEASKVLSEGNMNRVMDALVGFQRAALRSDLKAAKKASRGLGGRVVAEGAVVGDLAQLYLYVERDGKYFNQANKGSVSRESFRAANIQPDGEGGWGTDPAVLFKEQGGRVVQTIRWFPWAYFGAPQYIISEGTPYSAANLYQPPPIIQPNGDDGKVQLWHELFKHLIPDEREREVYMDHMAFTLQHPEVKIQWQILHIGQKRIGKDGILFPLAQFLGPNVSEIDLDDEAAKWGDTKSGRKALIFAEVHRPADRGFENQLKTMAASTASGTGWVNMKGGGLVQQENLYSIYAMSNYENCLHLDPDDARWFAISSLDTELMSEEFYEVYWNWMRHGSGVTDVAAWLLARDVTGFTYGKMPYHTDAYRAISAASVSNLASMLSERRDAGEGPFGRDLFTVADVMDYLRQRQWPKEVNRSILAHELKMIGCVKLKKRARKMVDGVVLSAHTLFMSTDNHLYSGMGSVDLYNAYQSVLAGTHFTSQEGIDSAGDIDSGGDV